MVQPRGPEGTAVPQVTVVVPTFNGEEGVHRLADALAAQTLPYDCWQLVIVDDGSAAPTAAALDELVGKVPFRARVMHNAHNSGPAAARNLGWRATTSPIVAYTDDDCFPHPAWLESGWRAITSAPTLGIVQGRTIRPPGSEKYPYTRYSIARDVPSPSPWFEGCNLFWRRAALEEVGGFDEVLAFHGEETSAAWTALESGWERGWAEDAVIEHVVEERPWRWHLRFQYLDKNLVTVAARHPEFRQVAFWRPWATRPDSALFAAAVAGTLVGMRWKPGLLATAPYLVWLRKQGYKDSVFLISKHAASLAGKLSAGVREGVLVV